MPASMPEAYGRQIPKKAPTDGTKKVEHALRGVDEFSVRGGVQGHEPTREAAPFATAPTPEKGSASAPSEP